jgi:hypothetical protein
LTDSAREALYARYGIKDNARATAASRVAAATGGDSAPPAAGGNAATTGAVAGGQGADGQGGQGRAGGGRRAQGASGSGSTSGDQGAGNAGGGGRRQDSAIVWKLLPNKELQPVQVSLGVTDFTFTEQVNGNLSPGDELVIGQSSNKSADAQTRNPVSGAGGPQGVPRRF